MKRLAIAALIGTIIVAVAGRQGAGRAPREPAREWGPLR
jgi:hypothetical protein